VPKNLKKKISTGKCETKTDRGTRDIYIHYTHTHIHARTHAHKHARTHTHAHTHTHTHDHTRSHTQLADRQQTEKKQTFVCLWTHSCLRHSYASVCRLSPSWSAARQQTPKKNDQKKMSMYVCYHSVCQTTNKEKNDKKKVCECLLSICLSAARRQTKKKSYTLGGLKILVNEASSY
jgi:hypothetical protein